MFVKPRRMPQIFCLNVQTDYYNDHPQHFIDALKRLTLNDQLGPFSTNSQGGISVKNTPWN